MLVNKLKYMILLGLIVGCTSNINTEKQIGVTSKSPFGEVSVHEPEVPFGKLIGSWKCISEDLVDSVWYTNDALWRWEYILGGHAMLNHWWQEDNSTNAPSTEYFANGVFIRNKDNNRWEAVIMNSRPHKLSPKFQLDFKNDKIHMHDGTETWLVTFFDIQEDSFEWKYEIKTREGEWSPISKIRAVRVK